MNISSINGYDPWSTYSSGQINNIGQELFSQISRKEDTDKSGSISKNESKLSEDIFSKIDTDSDGSITQEEFIAGFQNAQKALGSLNDQSSQMMAFQMQNNDYSGMASAVISDKDTDGDGVLSMDETGMDENRFSIADTDGDGSLSQSEIASDIEQMSMNGMPPPPPPPQGAENSDSSDSSSSSSKSSDRFDLNGDGTVTEEEIAKVLGSFMMDSMNSDSDSSSNMFSQMDADGNGQLSGEEFSNSVEMMRMMMGGGKINMLSQFLTNGFGSSSSSSEEENVFANALSV